ncbi:MAG TPA: hypothetical protein VN622_06965 [Clostridia bacterium]|nr:hypothetical protein [Clostridia bacterium]
MSTRDYCGLALLIVFAFTFPIVPYLILRAYYFIVDATFATRPDPRWRKIAASFSLALPVLTLLMFLQIGFGKFQKWWFESPYVVSALAVFFFLVVPVVLARAIVRIWRPRATHRRC